MTSSFDVPNWGDGASPMLGTDTHFSLDLATARGATSEREQLQGHGAGAAAAVASPPVALAEAPVTVRVAAAATGLLMPPRPFLQGDAPRAPSDTRSLGWDSDSVDTDSNRGGASEGALPGGPALVRDRARSGHAPGVRIEAGMGRQGGPISASDGRRPRSWDESGGGSGDSGSSSIGGGGQRARGEAQGQVRRGGAEPRSSVMAEQRLAVDATQRELGREEAPVPGLLSGARAAETTSATPTRTGEAAPPSDDVVAVPMGRPTRPRAALLTVDSWAAGATTPPTPTAHRPAPVTSSAPDTARKAAEQKPTRRRWGWVDLVFPTSDDDLRPTPPEQRGGGGRSRAPASHSTAAVAPLPAASDPSGTPAAAPAAATATATTRPVPAGQEPVVLVVDDSVSTLKATCMALWQRGVRAVAVEDGMVALEMASSPDLRPLLRAILIDRYMPSMDGVELCARLRYLLAVEANEHDGRAATSSVAGTSSSPKLPRLLLVGMVAPGAVRDQELFMRVGADAVLVKPVARHHVDRIAVLAHANSRRLQVGQQHAV